MWETWGTQGTELILPLAPIPTPPAQNARGASQQTGIAPQRGKWVVTPGPPWLLGTADGGRGQLSCPSSEHVSTGGRAEPSPAPHGSAMRGHGLLLVLCTLAGKICPPRERPGCQGGHLATPSFAPRSLSPLAAQCPRVLPWRGPRVSWVRAWWGHPHSSCLHVGH